MTLYQIHFRPWHGYYLALDGAKPGWPVVACVQDDGSWLAQPEYVDSIIAPDLIEERR